LVDIKNTQTKIINYSKTLNVFPIIPPQGKVSVPDNILLQDLSH